MIIHTVLGNRAHPEYGVASIPFPIPTEEYPRIIEMLEALEVGNVRKSDCHIAEIESPLPVLKCLEDTDVNVDELDYLAKRLNSYSDRELQQFQAMAAKNGYFKLKPGECGVLRRIDSMGTHHIDWDSGSGLGLVPNEDSFNILPPETTTLKLYMPMTLEQYERNQWGDYEGEPVEIPAYAVAQYENLIHEAILRERAFVDNKRGLMEYYNKLDSVNFKVKSYVFDVEERGGALWGVAKCEVYGELTDEELSKLKENIVGQAADGYGEHFEQREIRTEEGDIYAHLWNSGADWSVSTEEELFGQTQEAGMTLG